MKSFSIIVGGAKAEEVMKGYPIIIDELFILRGFVRKETIMGVRTLVEKELGTVVLS